MNRTVPHLKLLLCVTAALTTAISAQAQFRGKNASFSDAQAYEAQSDFLNASDAYLETVYRDKKGKYPLALENFFKCSDKHCQQLLNGGRTKYATSHNTTDLYNAITEASQYQTKYQDMLKQVLDERGSGMTGLAKATLEFNRDRKVGAKADFDGIWDLIIQEECKNADAFAKQAENSFVTMKYHDAYFSAIDAQEICKKFKDDARLEQIKSESLAKGQRKILIMPISITDMNLDAVSRLPNAIADTIKSYQDPFFQIIDQTELENKLFENDMNIEQAQAADINKLAALAKALNMRYVLVMKLVNASVPVPQLSRKRGTAFLIQKKLEEAEDGTKKPFYSATRQVEYTIVSGKRTSVLKVQVKLIDTQRKQILFSDFKETSIAEDIHYVDVGGYSIEDLSNVSYENDVANVRIPPLRGIVDWQSNLKSENHHRNLAADDVVQKRLVGWVAGRVVHDVIVEKLK